jgi:hypothetical protein
VVSGVASAPSWRRLIAATAVLFGVVFAFLSGRAHAGGEEPATTTAPAAPEPQIQPQQAPRMQQPAQVDPGPAPLRTHQS